MVIAIDFDGTCVSHEFPKVGKDIGAAPVLKRLIENGHQLILWTMRSNCEGNNGMFLDDAKKWFDENDIPLYGCQCNPTQKDWTTSPKCYAHIYIDDAALGCPLIYEIGIRPYVDWAAVEIWLENNNYISKTDRSSSVSSNSFDVEYIEKLNDFMSGQSSTL